MNTIMTKKEYKTLLAKYGPEELAASFVFPKNTSVGQNKKSAETLNAVLTKRRSSISKDDQIMASLLQLRYQIEDYVSTDIFDKNKTFGYFLKSYITILDKKRHIFADEIDIKATELSQYINDHRTPPQPVIIRLEIHSQNIIPAIHWYRLVEIRKLHEFISDQNIRREQIKFVKKQLWLDSI